jgi:hypothetical protein
MAMVIRWAVLILALYAGERAISTQQGLDPSQATGEGGSPPPPKP